MTDPLAPPLERLTGTVKDLVLALQLAAEDLAGVEPTDAKELDGKLRDLQDTVAEGVMAIVSAGEAYDRLPEEPLR